MLSIVSEFLEKVVKMLMFFKAIKKDSKGKCFRHERVIVEKVQLFFRRSPFQIEYTNSVSKSINKNASFRLTSR